MTGGDCRARAAIQRRVLSIALALNAAMFVIELAAGIFGQSTGLIADSLDMLADAFAYTIALAAMRGSAAFKLVAARLSGSLLMLLGIGVLVDVARRTHHGSKPESMVMIAVACLSLAVNATVLGMLGRFRRGEVHLRATWIFTRADVIANLGVIASGLAVYFTSSRAPDLLVGSAIGIYIVKEALEILRQRA